MTDIDDCFHLAIPSHDLHEAWVFYVDGLGCESGRRYRDRITLNFFGNQLVCHLTGDMVELELQMYPRHFGMILRKTDDFNEVLLRARNNQLKFFRDVFVRFSGRPEEHKSFFLQDPSNNLVEFKTYRHPGRLY